MSGNQFDDNPFRDLPEASPYAAPSVPGEVYVGGNPLLAPTICLLVLSLVFLGLLALSMPYQIDRFKELDLSTPEGVGQLTGGVVALVAWAIMMIVIAAGSICMLRLRGYGGAMTAAIISVIPCCSPCYVFGIPFGIWALILLHRPEVRSRFL